MPSNGTVHEKAFELQLNLVKAKGIPAFMGMLTRNDFLSTADLRTKQLAYLTVLKVRIENHEPKKFLILPKYVYQSFIFVLHRSVNYCLPLRATLWYTWWRRPASPIPAPPCRPRSTAKL